MASARIKIAVTLTADYSFDRVPFCGYGTETVHIYKFTDETGRVYVWKTTGILSKTEYTTEEVVDGWGYTWVDARGRNYYYIFLPKGSRFVISASVKGETEYKGEQQTELTRVKVEEVIFRAESEAEKAARIEAENEAKKAALLESIAEGDKVIEMPYKQFKEHYADCETVPGSFRRDSHNGNSYITVVVRAGRMKASGVRGEHFSGYEIEFTDEDGKTGFAPYRAVNEENAIKQAKKDFPKCNGFRCRRIYRYARG